MSPPRNCRRSAINSATAGAGIACAARHAALGEYESQEIPAARTIPRSSQGAGAAPEAKDNGAAKVADQARQGLAHAPPPVPDATLAAAITQLASASGFGTTPANGAPIVAKDDAGTARRGTGAATSAAATPDAATPDACARGATADGQALAIETEAAPTPVHVVDLKSWLPPAAPKGASASPERARTSTANAPNPPTGAALAAKDGASSMPPAPSATMARSSVQAQAAPPPASPFALQLQPSSAGTAPARKAAAPTTATPAPAANVSAPRRDLEIILEPKDLGGLAVRMKSAGDRLEIAFVADRGDTARLIDDKSTGLASQLRGAGLGLGGLDISVAAKSSDNLAAGLATTGGPSFGAPQNGEGGRQGVAQPRAGAMGQNNKDFTDEASERAKQFGRRCRRWRPLSLAFPPPWPGRPPGLARASARWRGRRARRTSR